MDEEFIKGLLAGNTEVLAKEVKKFGTSAYITIPKKYIGRKATVIIQPEEKKEEKKI